MRSIRCGLLSLTFDTLVSPAKTDEPIDLPFGIQTQVIPRNRCYMGAHIDASWRIRWIDICGSRDAALCYR